MSRKKLELICGLISFCGATFITWYHLSFFHGDLLSYMEMSDVFFHHRWGELINSHWPPGLSVYLGLAKLIHRPAPIDEVQYIHILFLIAYFAMLFAFSFFLNSFLELRRSRLTADPHEKNVRFSDETLIVTGYALLTWAALRISLTIVSYDIFVAIFCLLATGVAAKILVKGHASRRYAALGILFAAGYYFKYVFIVPACALLAVLVLESFSRGQVKKAAFRGALVAALTAFALTAPYIYLMSKKAGHPTIGDSAKMVYFDDYDHVSPIGDGSAEGHRVHPPKWIFKNPSVGIVGDPIPGAFPFWVDPFYWLDGLKVNVPRSAVLEHVKQNIRDFFELYFVELGPMTFATILLIGVSVSNTRRLPLKYWPVLAPSAAVILIYAPIHIEPRYVAGLLPILFLGLLGDISIPESLRKTKIPQTMIATALITLFIFFLPSRAREEGISPDRFAKVRDYEIAEALSRSGLGNGDQIASMDEIVPLWSRLAQVRATCFFGDGEAFKNLPDSEREKLYSALRENHVKAIVLPSAYVPETAKGWTPAAGGDFKLLLL